MFLRGQNVVSKRGPKTPKNGHWLKPQAKPHGGRQNGQDAMSRKNLEKVAFSGFSRYHWKSLFLRLFSARATVVKTDRERVGFSAKVVKTARIKHQKPWFLAENVSKTPTKTSSNWPKWAKMGQNWPF